MTPTQLKKIREKHSLSQWALAKAAKISRYNIAIFESGYRELTPDETKKINNAIKERKSC